MHNKNRYTVLKRLHIINDVRFLLLVDSIIKQNASLRISLRLLRLVTSYMGGDSFSTAPQWGGGRGGQGLKGKHEKWLYLLYNLGKLNII